MTISVGDRNNKCDKWPVPKIVAFISEWNLVRQHHGLEDRLRGSR